MKLISLFVLALGFSSLAHAAGFEKSVLWSGKEAGYANAGMSRIISSESLFFNPAGLAGGTDGGDFTLNVSPTSIGLEGAIAAPSVIEKTDKNYTTVGSAFAKYKVNEKFGVGVGAYVAGGSKSIYETVSLTGDSANVTFAPTIRTELKVIEYSIGAAYEIMPGLRFGAAWRITKVDGGLATIKKTIAGTAYSYLDIADAKQTRYNGYRLGLQYQVEKWGIGASFRNSVTFAATGTGTGSVTVIPTNTTTVATGSPTTIGSSLPWAAALGGNMRLNDNFLFLGAVEMTRYSNNQTLSVTGTLNGTALPNLPLNWKDMYVYRIGVEYTGIETIVLKAGFALVSPVTPKHDARATLTPPGTGKTITVGAGKSFMHDKVGIDAALEYSIVSASGSGSPSYFGDTTRELLRDSVSDYKAKSMALHIGANYRF